MLILLLLFKKLPFIQGGVIVHNDPFQKHEQHIGGLLLFWYANPTLIVQETALKCVKFSRERKMVDNNSVAEPHHFDAAPALALGKILMRLRQLRLLHNI
jgi:hypothetical protein